MMVPVNQPRAFACCCRPSLNCLPTYGTPAPSSVLLCVRPNR